MTLRITIKHANHKNTFSHFLQVEVVKLFVSAVHMIEVHSTTLDIKHTDFNYNMDLREIKSRYQIPTMNNI